MIGKTMTPTDSRISHKPYSRWVASTRSLLQRRRRPLHGVAGTAAEIADRLKADPVLPLVDTLRLELPYNFGTADDRQILDDVRRLSAPRLIFEAEGLIGPGRRYPF